MNMQMLEKYRFWLIFGVFLISRFAFKYISGYDHFELFLDSERYDYYSSQILSGNFNLDHTAFILAPLYPYFLAGVKWIFGMQWQFFAMLIQFVLVSISGIYIFKITNLLFKSEKIAWVATGAYCLFPMTLWYNFTFTQETLFQALFIFAIYHLLRLLQGKASSLVFSATFFSLAFLTKSHILLFSPFIVLLLLLSKFYNLNKKILYSLAYAGICFAFTLPYGLYNLKTNEVYALSSYGMGTFFHISNSEYTYREVFNPAPLGSEASKYGTYLAFAFDKDFEYQGYGKVNQLPILERQRIHKELAMKWIQNHPGDFLRLKWFSFYRFFMPGLSRQHHSTLQWLASFLLSLPVYLLGYWGIFQALKKDYRKHLWIALLMFTVLFFFVVFSPVSRFRTVTLEPFYIVYAAFGFIALLERFQLSAK